MSPFRADGFGPNAAESLIEVTMGRVETEGRAGYGSIWVVPSLLLPDRRARVVMEMRRRWRVSCLLLSAMVTCTAAVCVIYLFVLAAAFHTAWAAPGSFPCKCK